MTEDWSILGWSVDMSLEDCLDMSRPIVTVGSTLPWVGVLYCTKEEEVSCTQVHMP